MTAIARGIRLQHFWKDSPTELQMEIAAWRLHLADKFVRTCDCGAQPLTTECFGRLLEDSSVYDWSDNSSLASFKLPS